MKKKGIYYTGQGDLGTSKVGGRRIAKDSLILETLGELDELNSLIGVVKNHTSFKGQRDRLDEIQETLFIIQANVGRLIYSKFQAPKLSSFKIEKLEEEIQKIERKLKPERGFIIPGATAFGAWLDYARAVTRRVERIVYKLHKKHSLAPEILSYLNRLSSYFYALAREEAFRAKIKESFPRYR